MSGYPLSVSHLRSILHSDQLNYYECWEKRANKVMDHLPSLFSILSGKEVLKKKLNLHSLKNSVIAGIHSWSWGLTQPYSNVFLTLNFRRVKTGFKTNTEFPSFNFINRKVV